MSLHPNRPKWGEPDYWTYAILFNDVGKAETAHHILFSDRAAIADFLWVQGWRREVRPEDANSE